jgi:molybdate transport system ATP-binding protein
LRLNIPSGLGDIFSMLIHLENAAVELNHQVLLEKINLRIDQGDVLHLLGANGSGKSTLLKLLAGEHWHSSGKRTYYFTNPPRSSPIGAKQFIALVSPELQERYQRLNHDRSVLEVVQTGFTQNDFLYIPLESAQQNKVLEFAARFQINALFEQPFYQLSKGQMRQVLLTRALLLEPKLLLLDEFFSGVDTASRARLRGIVENYLEEGGTLVYTSHRQEETFASNQKTLLLEHQTIGLYNPKAAVQATTKLKTRQQKPQILITIKNANVYLSEPKDDATAIDGHASSPKKLILEQINFTLYRHQHWLITGHNGAGKSTFARLLRGDISPAFGGLVDWFGSSQTPIWQRQRRIALVSSDLQAWHRVDATGYEIIASGFFGGIGWHRPLEAKQQTQVETLLVQLEITHLANKNALHTSQGELRKLLLARALVTTPEVIILDEAFDYLDTTSRHLIWTVLMQQNATLLIIAHREEDKPPFKTAHLEFREGKKVKG